MRRIKWFKTRAEAKKFKEKYDRIDRDSYEIYKWKHTKRQKPYFLGTYIEWMNL